MGSPFCKFLFLHFSNTTTRCNFIINTTFCFEWHSPTSLWLHWFPRSSFLSLLTEGSASSKVPTSTEHYSSEHTGCMTRTAAFLSSSVALTRYHHVRMPKPDKNIKLKDSRLGDIIENIPKKLNLHFRCTDRNSFPCSLWAQHHNRNHPTLPEPQ